MELGCIDVGGDEGVLLLCGAWIACLILERNMRSI